MEGEGAATRLYESILVGGVWWVSFGLVINFYLTLSSECESFVMS